MVRIGSEAALQVSSIHYSRLSRGGEGLQYRYIVSIRIVNYYIVSYLNIDQRSIDITNTKNRYFNSKISMLQISMNRLNRSFLVVTCQFRVARMKTRISQKSSRGGTHADRKHVHVHVNTHIHIHTRIYIFFFQSCEKQMTSIGTKNQSQISHFKWLFLYIANNKTRIIILFNYLQIDREVQIYQGEIFY